MLDDAPMSRPRLTIALASPARAGSIGGNGTSVARWREQWSALGYRVRVTTQPRAPTADLLVALHATKCAAVIEEWHAKERGPLVVVLSGTDIYGENRARMLRSLERAHRIVALQQLACDVLPARLRAKSACIPQSCAPIARRKPRRGQFEVALVAGLRKVKDPLRCAYAVRTLPKTSRLHVTHYGPALDDALASRASELSDALPRYAWHGARTRGATRLLLGRARALCVPSRSEGGANVVSEAIAAELPIVCSDVPGNLGVLGEDWPARFAVGDTRGLRELLLRLERDEGFSATLRERIRGLQHSVSPAKERGAWAEVFDACF